jgi:hypothetical protein
MHSLILWSGFFGAWLLFAGPVYQAVLELEDEAVEFDRIRALTTHVPPMPRLSPWWWLLPPVGFLLDRRRRNRQQLAVVGLLSDEDYLALTGYVNKATGWVFVGLGGFLIAVKETYELTEGLDWPVASFWLLVVLMVALSVGNARLREAHTERAIAQRQAGRS